MNRLPSYDVRTGRAERGIFLTLALAALASIVITAWNGSRFATDQDKIVLAPAPEDIVRIETKNQIASTNLTIYKSGGSGEKSRLGGFGAPKS
jgi:hypothetical protein